MGKNTSLSRTTSKIIILVVLIGGSLGDVCNSSKNSCMEGKKSDREEKGASLKKKSDVTVKMQR